MTLSKEQLERLERLRGLFLDERGDAALCDYWRDPEDLRAYEAILAVRIGWKWRAAIDEAAERGFVPPPDATVLDFGCGSGIAGRVYAERFGAGRVWCHDRSSLAMKAAAALARAALPAVVVEPLRDVGATAPDVLLVSHVLGELDARGEALLDELVRRSGLVLIVEPGSREVSRRLSALRDRLPEGVRVLAPCPHAAKCPALASPGDWCHFFAEPPARAFTDGDWVKAARAVGIDQRALPYSFLALARGEAGASGGQPGHRLLGRPRVGKHAATVQLCTEHGLVGRTVEKRSDQELWRRLKKSPFAVRSLP
jgi:SAM-dependent methyltransferase